MIIKVKTVVLCENFMSTETFTRSHNVRGNIFLDRGSVVQSIVSATRC